MSKLLKSKFFLGVLVVAVLVGGFAFTMNAKTASADCSITSTLRAGSSGAEVQCLQSIVGASADGKFGPLTQAAVMAWQSGHGLQADGVVGPLTRAALMSSPMAGLPAGCVAGGLFSSTTGLSCSVSNLPAGCVAGGLFSSTTGLSCSVSNLPAGCVAGALFSSTTGASCSGAVSYTSTGQGSATLDYEPIPAAGVSIYTGASKTPGVTFKIKATGSDMKVNSLSLDTNERIWLDASVAYLMQGSTVLATVPLNSSSVVEVTTGSVWRINFTGFNIVAPAGVNTDLTVAFDRPTVTQNNNTVTIATTSYIRATDGTGFTTNVSPTSTRTMAFSAAAATQGTLTTSLNANSPLAQSVSGLSATASVLTAVKLADFDLKGTNAPITVTSLAGSLTSSGTLALASEVASVELRDGSTVLASVTGASGTLTFSSLNVQVPKDGTKTVSVWAQMNPVAAAVAAGYTQKADGIKFTLDSSATTAFDANYNTVTVTSADPAGYYQYMFQYAPTFTLGAVSASQVDESTSTVVNNGGQYSMAFTVTAPSGSDIYFNTPYTGNATGGLLTSTYAVDKIGSGGGALVPSVSTSGTAQNGATLTTFDKIPAGTSKTITVTGYIPAGTGAGFVGMEISAAGVQWADADAVANKVAQTWGFTEFHTPTVHVTAN